MTLRLDYVTTSTLLCMSQTNFLECISSAVISRLGEAKSMQHDLRNRCVSVTDLTLKRDFGPFQRGSMIRLGIQWPEWSNSYIAHAYFELQGVKLLQDTDYDVEDDDGECGIDVSQYIRITPSVEI